MVSRNKTRPSLLKRVLLVLLVIFGLAAMTIVIIAGIYAFENKTNGSLVSSGEKRSYLLYVPDSYNPAKPTPLVITIHGFMQWPAHQARISRWNDLADEYGFIVVYPSGTGFPKHWRTYGAARQRNRSHDRDPFLQRPDRSP